METGPWPTESALTINHSLTLVPCYSIFSLPPYALGATVLQRSINPQTCMFLGCGKKPEHTRETHAVTGRTCKLHVDSARTQDGTRVSGAVLAVVWRDFKIGRQIPNLFEHTSLKQSPVTLSDWQWSPWIISTLSKWFCFHHSNLCIDNAIRESGKLLDVLILGVKTIHH